MPWALDEIRTRIDRKQNFARLLCRRNNFNCNVGRPVWSNRISTVKMQGSCPGCVRDPLHLLSSDEPDAEAIQGADKGTEDVIPDLIDEENNI